MYIEGSFNDQQGADAQRAMLSPRRPHMQLRGSGVWSRRCAAPSSSRVLNSAIRPALNHLKSSPEGESHGERTVTGQGLSHGRAYDTADTATRHGLRKPDVMDGHCGIDPAPARRGGSQHLCLGVTT